MRLDTELPIIAIEKSYVGGQLRITSDIASARLLAAGGADVIALDCTDRMHAWAVRDGGRGELHREDERGAGRCGADDVDA